MDPLSLQIVHYPDPVLQRRAGSVETIDDVVRAVAARMIELMHEAEGIGLAAPQVGLEWRLFVLAGLGEDEPDLVCINPTLTVIDSEMTMREEGCLSLPGIHVDVRRPGGIRMEALDAHGEPFTITDHGYRARVWQHEFDHLEGKLIIQRMSPMARIATRKALKELKAAYQQQ